MCLIRVLLASSLGGAGHLAPVASAAAAARRLGCETKILVPRSLVGQVERSGADYVVGDEPPRAVVDEVWSRVRAGPPDVVAGLIDRELFADRCTQAMLGTARAVRDSWGPNLIVREPCEYASAIVAHEAGIPQAQVGISLSAIERSVLETVESTIESFSSGVASTISPAPYLTSFPSSLDPSPWQDTRRFHHPVMAAHPLPAWWPTSNQPLVYVTFGSVIGHLHEAPDVYRTVLDAIATLPARVLLTVGRGTDLGSLGEVPQNTHVERWVDQKDVLPYASVVVCHGGSGTTFGALAAGVPLVICPLFADQLTNGPLIAAAGAAVLVDDRDPLGEGVRRLGPADVVPLRAAIHEVLRGPSYRNAAQRLAAEMAATPTLADTIGSLLAQVPRTG